MSMLPGSASPCSLASARPRCTFSTVSLPCSIGSVSRTASRTIVAFVFMATSCGPALTEPALRASTEDLKVAVDAPECPTVARTPDEREVTRNPPYESVHGCFPIELDGNAPCEWACATIEGGPCGNGGTYDWLVIMVADGSRYVRAGQIGLAHGEYSLGFVRKVHAEHYLGKPALIADLWWRRRGRTHTSVERYVLEGKQLRQQIISKHEQAD